MRIHFSRLLWLIVCCQLSQRALAQDLQADPSQQREADVDKATLRLLLGSHPLSLQWISWDHPGMVSIIDDDGVLRVEGSQTARQDGDYLKIEGVITEVKPREFSFVGQIVTRVSHINNGKSCTRSGNMRFRATGKRKYWRLRQMDNPCDGVTDYVDIYFRRWPGANPNADRDRDRDAKLQHKAKANDKAASSRSTPSVPAPPPSARQAP
jgi:hypothetical protein